MSFTQDQGWRSQTTIICCERIGRKKLGEDRGSKPVRAFTLNLRNRLIFKAADEEGAVQSADFLGKRRTITIAGYSADKRSSNYSEHDENKIKSHLLRNFPKHTAVRVHCERGLPEKANSSPESPMKSLLLVRLSRMVRRRAECACRLNNSGH